MEVVDEVIKTMKATRIYDRIHQSIIKTINSLLCTVLFSD